MKIKTTLGVLAGKLSGSILEKMGRGSTLPGKLALKFDKDILSQLAKNYEIVVITGTNGKTLTTALTVGILQEAFGPILTNPSGANMISGITTTFLRAKHSKSNRPIAVLEIDEASLSRICDYQYFPGPDGSLRRDLYDLSDDLGCHSKGPNRNGSVKW